MPGTIAELRAAFALIAFLLVSWPASAADEQTDALALKLIDRFYDDLAPDNTALAGFLGEGFQIIGSDGLHFDREGYLSFPKQITRYEISDLSARRDGDVITAIFEVGYVGEIGGVEREVPRLPRIAVFHRTDDGWKLQALAALGTGINDVSPVAQEVVTAWQAALASGDTGLVRRLSSPDFQLTREDGTGSALDEFLGEIVSKAGVPFVADIVATSFSNTMVVRYTVQGDEDDRPEPRLTVFQRIDGAWRAAGEARYFRD